jgi:hypothetical protein
MKKILLLSALSTLFLMPSLAHARATEGDCYIQNFVTEITVNKNSSADIREDITADCGTIPGKHGIFRVLPYELINRPTTENPLTAIHLQNITDEKNQAYLYTTSVSRADKTITWKIGDVNQTITGVHHYIIIYRADNVIQHPEGTDLFAWNLNGNFWQLTTDSFTGYIRFPQQITPENTTVKTYTGMFGGTNSNLAQTNWLDQAHPGYSQTLEVSSLGALTANQGITLYASLPKHIFDAYTQPAVPLTDWSWLLLIPVSGLFFWLYWRKNGKDTRFGAQVVYYEPPADLKPMELGLLDTFGGSRPAQLTATIIDLAVRGYITISPNTPTGVFKTPDWQLTRTSKADGLAMYEQELLVVMGLTLENQTVAISQLQTVLPMGMQSIRAAAQKTLNDMGVFDSRGVARQLGVFAISFLMGIAGFFQTTEIGNTPPYESAHVIASALGLIISAVIGFVFALIMNRRTEKGAELEYQLKGFQLYMKTAEKYRSQFYEKENMFEKVLPYAILFGLTTQWIKATKSMFTEQQMASYAPVWYLGTGGMPAFDSFDTFNSQMNTISAQMNAVATPPSSSGGGGFSGGGGGGGGGGSW